MRNKLHKLTSYRQRQEKLKLKIQFKIWALIVLARVWYDFWINGYVSLN